MTRKDYELIAACFRAEIENDSPAFQKAMQQRHHAVLLRIASALASDNPRFDRARFLKACGIN